MSSKSRIAARLTVRRGLDECEAAVYLSLSPSFFRQLVAEGTMPRPRVVKRRRIWDIDELDLAFKALPREAFEDQPATATGNSWADYQ
jgi:excisionase family DNA binding protein